MFVKLRGLLLQQVTLFIAILVIFYFSTFLAGYGSSNKHLQDEKNMFLGFAASNLILGLLYLIIKKRFRMLEVAVTVVLTLTLYSLSYFYFYR
jgi:tryptophan-rich sensory protein